MPVSTMPTLTPAPVTPTSSWTKLAPVMSIAVISCGTAGPSWRSTCGPATRPTGAIERTPGKAAIACSAPASASTEKPATKVSNT